MNISYVYLIGWKKLDTWYCGCEYKKKAHPQNLWTKYFTSSKHVERFRKENGEPDHIEILKEFPNDPRSARIFEEQKLIEFDAVEKPNWLNRCIKGESFHFTHHSEESKKLIGSYHKGKIISEEHRKKISIFFKGKKRKPFSKEWKRKISESQIGKIVSKETGRKISEKAKGRKLKNPRSLEHCQKISESAKNRRKAICQYCNRELPLHWIKRHINSCSKVLP